MAKDSLSTVNIRTIQGFSGHIFNGICQCFFFQTNVIAIHTFAHLLSASLLCNSTSRLCSISWSPKNPTGLTGSDSLIPLFYISLHAHTMPFGNIWFIQFFFHRKLLSLLTANDILQSLCQYLIINVRKIHHRMH